MKIYANPFLSFTENNRLISSFSRAWTYYQKFVFDIIFLPSHLIRIIRHCCCALSTLFSSKALNGSTSFVGALCIWRLAHFDKIGVEEQRPCANPFFKSLHNWKNSSSEKLIFQFPFVFWDTFISYLGMIILNSMSHHRVCM